MNRQAEPILRHMRRLTILVGPFVAFAGCKFPELPPLDTDASDSTIDASTPDASDDAPSMDGPNADSPPTDGSTCQLRMAYYSQLGGDNEIWVSRPDGSAAVQITTNTFSDSVPKVSPDGTKIVFVSDRDGNTELYVMNVDGSGVQNLTNSPAADAVPSWSPDGTKIAFRRDSALYVMNADGSGQMARSAALAVAGYFPSWTQNGSSIVFLSGGDIYSVGTLTGTPVNLTSTAAAEERPTVSPDGAKIAFQKRNASNKFTVSVMNANGTLQQTIVENAFHNFGPNWSPDGTSLAFTSDRDGNNELYKVASAGGPSTPIIVRAQTSDAVPFGAWSPDGTLIAYETAVSAGSSEVHIVAPDGTGEDDTTVGPQDFFGAWIPCP